MIRRPALLLLASFALGSVLAGQEPGKEIDARTATENGARVDPASDVAAEPIDANEIRTAAEADAAFAALAARSEAAWANDAERFLATRDDLSVFLMLLEQANLAGSLVQGDKEITIFAPSDAAFAAMDAEEFTTLVEDPAALRDFLQRHIVAGDHSTSAIAARLRSGAVGSGPGVKMATAGAGLETAVAGGGDAISDIDAEARSSVLETSRSIAGGGPAPEVTPAGIPVVDPSSTIELKSREGSMLSVGTRPLTVRTELQRLEASDGRADRVAGGGGPVDAEDVTFYVGNAQIVESDLSIDGLTVHVIDRVLLPTPGDAAVAR